ncbi:LRR receptor-like serine/threonine-protein kinase ERECTA [Olea europaea var. sylvestris]|uniref:LRR receptor-like serine/threonine-protein kinase ERECTA n=1 Tax=Olea europaea var. sylvestris TaxID=158386 RepID=UPI000C1D3D98|nr:LRR receptor-like serine/threonine-protein kinase ERECTA [Olea europaea var. sylvestris]
MVNKVKTPALTKIITIQDKTLAIKTYLRLGKHEITRSWCQLKNLEKLDLSKNKYKGLLPSCLGNMTSLRFIDLSYNRFVGNIAFSPLPKLKSLEYLLDVLMAISGPLKLPSSAKLDMGLLDISNNDMRGEVPTNISAVFPNLIVLNMSRNVFDGCVPSSFDDLKSLEFLDLSNNNLSGQVPEELGAGSSSLLPISMGKMTTVRQVAMSKNHLGGSNTTGILQP